METDVTSDKKTREHTEGAAAVLQTKHRDSCSAKRLQVGPTSFGMKYELHALPRWDDVLVHKDAEASKPCLSHVETRTLTAAGGLLPAGTASASMRTTFSRSLPSLTLGEETIKISSRTNNNQLALPCRRKLVRTKSRQKLVFNPGGSTGHLRAFPFLRTWRELLCGEVLVWVPAGGDLERFW